MHYRGFVFVEEPTEELVEEYMSDYGDGIKWDWYRCGGREDGYLQGDAEMDARKTHNGFNHGEEHRSAARNSCKARDLPLDRREVYFFLSPPGAWVEGEVYIIGYPEDRIERNALFGSQLEQCIADYPDWWIVVVDVHN